MFDVHYMFPYIYNEHERDSWLFLKNSGIWRRKMELRWEGGYTTVYNLTFVPSCNFANHKSDLSPNQTQVDLSFLKDTTRRSCLRLRPLQSFSTTFSFTWSFSLSRRLVGVQLTFSWAFSTWTTITIGPGKLMKIYRRVWKLPCSLQSATKRWKLYRI